MKLQLYKYRCGCCGAWFTAPELAEFEYGQFLLRSKTSDELAYLDSIKDVVYDEVSAIVSTDSREIALNQFDMADVLGEVFGLACDRDKNGEAFSMAAKPRCPQCGQSNLLEWEAIEPPTFVEIDVRPVSHIHWNSLNDSERLALILRGIDGISSAT